MFQESSIIPNNCSKSLIIKECILILFLKLFMFVLKH